MRDRLDGIKTFEGRVVYDRKQHPFTERDLGRIIKSINESIDENPGPAPCNRLSVLVGELLGGITAALRLADREFCTETMTYIMKIMAKLIRDYDPGLRESGFGGAGATREDI